MDIGQRMTAGCTLRYVIGEKLESPRLRPLHLGI
jgi:hypothetical protein